MSTRPHVRNIMSSIVSKLEIIFRTIQCKLKETAKMKKKWSDVVTDRYVVLKWNQPQYKTYQQRQPH